MTTELAMAFQDRLRQAERTRDVRPLVELFSESAELGSLVSMRSHHGKRGAEEFWREYLNAFQEVRSNFTGTVVEREGRVALEWESDATLRNGRALHYRGVSILETENGKVSRFRTYYDTAPFLGPRAAYLETEHGPEARVS